MDDPATYKYCLKSGQLPLLGAACDWYKRSYGMELDPEKCAAPASTLPGLLGGGQLLKLATACLADGHPCRAAVNPRLPSSTCAGLQEYWRGGEGGGRRTEGPPTPHPAAAWALLRAL